MRRALGFLGIKRRIQSRRLRARAEILQERYGLDRAEARKVAEELENVLQKERRRGSASR